MDVRDYEEIVHGTNNYGLSELDRFKLCTALSGEVGEFCNVVKKYKGGITSTELVNELGDILWYLTALTHHFGTTLEDIMSCNAGKVVARRMEGKTYNLEVTE